MSSPQSPAAVALTDLDVCLLAQGLELAAARYDGHASDLCAIARRRSLEHNGSLLEIASMESLVRSLRDQARDCRQLSERLIAAGAVQLADELVTPTGTRYEPTSSLPACATTGGHIDTTA